MRRGLVFVALLLALLSPSEAHARRQHVRGYTRSNGTYVHGYTREMPDDPEAALLGLVLLVIILIAVLVNAAIEGQREARWTAPPRRVSRRQTYEPSPAPVLRPETTGIELGIKTSDEPPRRVSPGGLVRFAAGCVGAVCRALSFQWVAKLPDWAQPIVWGVTVVSPLVGLFALRTVANPLIGEGAVFLGFVSAGCLVGGLTYDVARDRDERKRAMRIARFRVALSQALRPENARGFSFEAFRETQGMVREEAVAAAEGLYRNFSRKVAADGVVTASERGYLEALREALGIEVGRCRELEAEGKSEAYREAVADAKADGVVTEEEVRELDFLRRSLGLRDVERVAEGVVGDE